MNPLTLIFFFLGLALLIVGAETLVRGAARLAALIGISPLIIGLTVVTFGTSSPEMAVSVQTALSNRSDISLGNLVGSNIFNILFILGTSATITPLAVSRQLVRLDVAIMIGVSVIAMILGFHGKIHRWEGILLFSGIVVYTYFLFYQTHALSGKHE